MESASEKLNKSFLHDQTLERLVEIRINRKSLLNTIKSDNKKLSVLNENRAISKILSAHEKKMASLRRKLVRANKKKWNKVGRRQAVRFT